MFKADLAELYTRGRHFGGIIFVAMHTLENLDAKTSKNISNFIIHQSAANVFGNTKTILAPWDM